ncbi:MAG: tyrosine-type recombinase/integrase [Rhodoglobus sp.]
MSSTIRSLQQLVQDFFEQHLPIERNASRNTIVAYRDAMKLFLQHASTRARTSPDQLANKQAIDVAAVRAFLSFLEKQRGCGPRTRNQRLAAIKAFARYVASVAPEHLERCRRIREMPPARCEHVEVKYLEDAEILGLINATNSVKHRRDRALLLLLYNSGARVQELVDLNIRDIVLDPMPYVVLVGKGRKQRTCPLWTKTVEAIRAWLDGRPKTHRDDALFLNARGARLSRSGVADILRRLTSRAKLAPHHAARVSPHVIRHTTAMHLLQSGVDITTIAAWLGHADLSTTHGYVEINLRMKQAAVSALESSLPKTPRYRFPSGGLLTWLTSLGSPGVMRSQPPTTRTRTRRFNASSA